MAQHQDDEADLLPGAKLIAKFLGLRARQVLYLVEKRRIPVFRIGNVIYSRKSTLRSWMDEQERLAKSGPLNAQTLKDQVAA